MRQNKKIGYRTNRDGTLQTFIVGPRGGKRNYFGGFMDLEDLTQYLKEYSKYELFGEI